MSSKTRERNFVSAAAFTMFDDFSGAAQASDLAHAGDDLPIPLHAELEVLVGVDARRIDSELGHNRSSVSGYCRGAAGGGTIVAGSGQLPSYGGQFGTASSGAG